MLERSWLTPATSSYDRIWLMALLVFLVVLPVVLLCWSRYLYHKETMRMLELGGNGRAALEMRERWRIRRGLLTGVIVTVLGVAVFGRFVLLAKQVGGWLYLGPGGEVIRLGSLVVAAMGVIMLIAYATWSQGRPLAGAPGETEAERERWRVRGGLMFGTALILLGGAILALTPAASELIPKSRDPEHYFGVTGIFAASLGALKLLLYGIWSRGRPSAPGGPEPGKGEVPEQRE